MKTYLFTYSLSLLISLGLTPLVIYWASKRHLVDIPNARTIHTKPIARIGGIAIFIATMLTVLLALALQNIFGDQLRTCDFTVTPLLISATMMFAVGLYDDLINLRARTKLLFQLLAALLMCISGIYIQHFTIRDLCVIELGGFGYLLTLFWIIGVTNAVNLIDGLDGLAGGISAIACGVIAILSVWQGNTLLAIIMLALLGSLTGFLCYNFHPAKIFMGDGGSLFLGFTIATASVFTAAKSEALVGLGLPILVLGIPIIDTLLCIVRRFLERRGIMSPDRSHFHHHLLNLGLSQPQVAIIAYLITLLITGLGCFMLASRGAPSVLIWLCCLTLLLIIFRLVGAVRLHEMLAAIHHRSELSHQKFIERKLFEDAQLQFRNVENLTQWWRCMCMAAEAFCCAKLCLTVTNENFKKQRLYWDNNEKKKGEGEEMGREDFVTVFIPLSDIRNVNRFEVEIKVFTLGTIEGAGRRISLLSRLAEENRSTLLSVVNSNDDADALVRLDGYVDKKSMEIPFKTSRTYGNSRIINDIKNVGMTHNAG